MQLTERQKEICRVFREIDLPAALEGREPEIGYSWTCERCFVTFDAVDAFTPLAETAVCPQCTKVFQHADNGRGFCFMRVRREDEVTRVEDIIRAVASVAGVPIEAIKGDQKKRSVYVPRQVGMLLACELRPDLSHSKVAVWFGKDSTTVIHAKRRVTERLAANSERDAHIYRKAKEMLGV